MLPRGDRLHGMGVVMRGRRGDDHRVAGGEQRLGRQRRGADFGGRRRGAGRIGIMHPGQHPARRQLQRMEAPEMPNAQHADPASHAARSNPAREAAAV